MFGCPGVEFLLTSLLTFNVIEFGLATCWHVFVRCSLWFYVLCHVSSEALSKLSCAFDSLIEDALLRAPHPPVFVGCEIEVALQNMEAAVLCFWICKKEARCAQHKIKNMMNN